MAVQVGEVRPPEVLVVQAAKADRAVVVAQYSGRLSRVFFWDTRHDLVTHSTWIKARLSGLTLSPDGEHFAYMAETFSKRPASFLGVSRPPYTTALLFWPVFHLSVATVVFGEKKRLLVEAYGGGWNNKSYVHIDKGTGKQKMVNLELRVEDGCPFDLKIVDTCLKDDASREVEEIWYQGTEGRKFLTASLDLEIQFFRKTRPPLKGDEQWPEKYRSAILDLVPPKTTNWPASTSGRPSRTDLGRTGQWEPLCLRPPFPRGPFAVRLE